MTRRLLAILSGILTVLLAHAALAQTVDLSLNLQYANVANPALGGGWTLVAKTNSASGIASINAILSNINAAGITAQAGIGSVLDGGSPFVNNNGSSVEILYFQDLSSPASVVPNVGRGAGTPGNLPLDPLNDPLWNNSASIFSGTFGASTPAFTTNNDVPPNATDANVLAVGVPPFSTTAAAPITSIVRDNLSNLLGDYNLNGTVDAADYTVWRNTLGAAGAGLAADGSGNSVVDQADYDVWKGRFGMSSGSGAALGPGTTTAVPEPGAWTIIVASFAIATLLSGRRRIGSRVAAAILLAGVYVGFDAPAKAANRTWIGGNNDWFNGGSTANWSPADEPDIDDTAIFNTNNAVNLGSNNDILALTLSAGIDLDTSGFDLNVNGLVQLTGSSTNLIVGDSASLFTADSITINNLANVELNGGTIQVNEEAGNGLLDINAGGDLVGHGTLSMTDAVAANTTLIVNDGAITARRAPLTIFGAPQVGTLSINATDTDARIDLDGLGAGENGVVNVTRNQTLDLNIPLFDVFSGTMNLFHNAKFDSLSGWGMNGGTINVDNGFVEGGMFFPDIPAGVSIIAGGQLGLTGGTINILDTDGALQFDAAFIMNGGSLVNNGLVVFNSSAVIANAANITMPTTSSSLRVEGAHTVTINQANFNMDGANAATNVITVTGDSSLTINTGDYDTDSATNAFDGTVNLDNSTININVADAEFVMDGVLNSSASGSDQSLWTGDALDIGNDAGALDADVNINGLQPTQFGAQVDFNSDADMNVADGATAHFLAVVNFNSVNGGNNAQFTGAGELIFSAGVNFSEATTLNMVGGTVDLDGADSIGDTINVDAPLTINAELMRSFGKNNGGGGTNLLDINNSANTGSLTVNLDGADAEWTLNAQGVISLVNDATAATLLAGNDVNVNGTMNITGDVRTTARLDISGTVNINTAAEPLRLAAGNETTEVNTIAGGTVNGGGILGADTGKALHGFGTINTQIDFDGSSDLMADNGTLNIDGAKILDVETLGTADSDGVLNVTNAWNNNVTGGVQLRGGTLSGGTITNDTAAGISGHGLVTAKVINNSQLFASIADTLIFDTSGDDNDWDGTTGDGEIEAISGNIEIRDSGAPFAFTGTVSATNGHSAFTNGFGLDFNAGSNLTIATGGKFQSTNSTDLGGAVTVGAGGATIEVEINSFLSFESGSTTNLGSNLQLKNNNIIIEAGATFSGAGALVVPDGSHVVAENLADIGVLLDMQGGFRPGNSAGLGRIELLDYQQADTAELFVELTGTGLNQFDRLVVDGDAIVDGYLNIDIDGGFVPVLGNMFNIITANNVTGQFDFADVSGMPDGLTFHINYLLNAVQLQVVNTPFFSADFDDDGDVDATDLSIWKGAFDLNQLGDADGDNDSDGADLLIWQREFGSHPGAGTGSGAVPEPASLILLLFALSAIRYAACPLAPDS